MKFNNKKEMENLNHFKKNKNYKKTIDNQKSFKIISFYFFLFKNNIFFWILSVLLLVSQPLTMIILYYLNLNLVNYSFVFNISPLIIGLIWLLFLVNKLFLENKLNGIDVIMLSKPISKYQTLFYRIIIIFSFTFVIMFAQFILTSILVSAFQYDTNWISYVLVNNLFITPFIFSLVSAILILLAIIFKSLWFGLLSFLLILAIGAAPVIQRIIGKNDINQTLTYNDKNYNSFSKLTIINGEKNKTFLVDQINVESQINVNKDVMRTLNDNPFYNNLIPGEIILSLSSSLLNDLNLNNHQIEGNYSLLKNEFIDTQLANLDMKNNILLSIRPNDISPFELNSVEYENLLLDNIKKIANDSINFINLKDEKLVNLLFGKIQNSLNWSTASLSQIELLTIKALLGINVEFSQLFYYFNNREILNQKTPNILKRIDLELNPSLGKLLSFLWENNNSKINVFDLKTFGDVSEFFPNAKIKSLTSPTNINDINFIKNDLIRFSGTAIHYLDNNKQYIPTSLLALNKIDPTIVDKLTWDKVVDNYSVTLENTIKLFNLLNTNLNNNIFPVQFQDNEESLFKYSHFIEVKTTTYLDNVSLSIMTTIFITAGANILSIYLFKNKNYKN
ncbi:MAG: hypothetical protein ACRDAW_00810 [Metamycoplasmataceae bacterium]